MSATEKAVDRIANPPASGGPTNRGILRQALDLAYKNPDMPISLYVDSEELVDGMQYTSHKFVKVSVDLWFPRNENIYTDEDTIHSLIEDEVWDAAAPGYYDDGAHAEEFREAFDEIYDAQVSERIVIYSEPD
jgi:hypothetical protein